MSKVTIAHHFFGVFDMIACCTEDATDEEIVDYCNANNPAGTTGGWYLHREDCTPCEAEPGRLHYVLSI